jgi:hypothetical protein
MELHMLALKTITISMPAKMSKEIVKVAKEEHCTVSELLRETFRQNQALRNLRNLAAEGKNTAKKRKQMPHHEP